MVIILITITIITIINNNLQKKQSKIFFRSQNQDKWMRMSLMNIAASGKFSSDRTIGQYATEIWGVEPNFDKFATPFENPQKEQEAIEAGI